MTLRAVRPLDSKASAAANSEMYGKYPSMGREGTSFPLAPNDPCSKLFNQEWLTAYEKHGGKVETDPVLPPCPPGATIVACPAAKTELTEAEAGALFKELAANRNIPFDYPVDCCFSRAHSMCGMMKAKGIACEKYWIYSKNYGTSSGKPELKPVRLDGSPVVFPNGIGIEKPVAWTYHVAPLVTVKKADGSVEKMVMDPSVADRPLTTSEWQAIQGSPAGATVQTTSADLYYTNPDRSSTLTDPDYSQACSMMEAHKDRRETSKAALELRRKKSSGP